MNSLPPGKADRRGLLFLLLLLRAAAAAAQEQSPAPNPVPVRIANRGWIRASVLRCEGERLWLALPGRSGEFAVPCRDVLWTAFAFPPDLPDLERRVARNDPTALAPVMELHERWEAMMPIPGSPAPRISYTAAAAVDRDDPQRAEAILRNIAGRAWDVNYRNAAGIDLAERRLAEGDSAESGRLCRSVLDSTPAPIHAARAWETLGRTLEARGRYEEALDAFLHVVVLYARHRDILRKALEGAERCLRGLGRDAEAGRYRAELEAEFPDSPEAPPEGEVSS